MEKSQAILVVHEALGSGKIHVDKASVNTNDVSYLKPNLYLFDISLNTNHVIKTIRGRIPFNKKENNPTDPPEWAFFVDWLPNANWEHPCSYVYVHKSGALTSIAETAPPTQHSAKHLQRLDSSPAHHQ
ncbi:MAG: hypothetical protein ETSY2_48445 [Candidatus Entotheonella gemina]|uniref:Uncharacterized protein n=1 Tax=Candidatus Entotheonella gemina TaxID=1429439 RepID=W4LAX5_9BACT|nr:MAG: hypothetical protein ETSY2_48445 [Candidatus Entotheonella gemina]